MARDQGLEEILREDFETLNALAEKVMFLLARLLDGKLIFAARDDGMLVRLGKGRDSWTFEPVLIGYGEVPHKAAKSELWTVERRGEFPHK
ncbi:hypothetical protein [Serratia fonticola]|uniref:GAF domain-containing protein n=1 Tax=Serratia fonticola TaxID=47917 RepID=A0ABY9PUX5_SERFO|nr:hypothetical protein [Serratia fonticola]WMT17211.1 hypothetical protein RFB13_13195 [Serratia fonticola]